MFSTVRENHWCSDFLSFSIALLDPSQSHHCHHPSFKTGVKKRLRICHRHRLQHAQCPWWKQVGAFLLLKLPDILMWMCPLWRETTMYGFTSMHLRIIVQQGSSFVGGIWRLWRAWHLNLECETSQTEPTTTDVLAKQLLCSLHSSLTTLAG